MSKTVMLLAGVLFVHVPAFAALRGAERAKVLPLETMSFDEAAGAGAVGTGCTWLGGPERTTRVSMADDRAAVKLSGRVVSLKPAPDAVEVFPFTYHSWTAPGMELRIRDTKKVVSSGGEYVETIALLDLVEKTGTRTWVGRLNCGS